MGPQGAWNTKKSTQKLFLLSTEPTSLYGGTTALFGTHGQRETTATHVQDIKETE